MKEVSLTFNRIDTIKEVNPLVHVISNFVTMNDVAQSLSFLGARPIMSHYYKDVEHITGSSNGLVINLGTMDNFREEGVLEAANIAKNNSIPWILDPVGIHSSPYRKNISVELIDKYNPNVIKGNLSEVKSILGKNTIYKGIDSLEESLMINKELQREVEDYARNSNVIIVITGDVDFITDGKTTYYVYNGDGIMSRVTGTGCILSVLIGAFISVEKSKKNLTLAVVEAVSFWGIIGEICKEELKKSEGLNIYRFNLLDKISLISKKDLMLRSKVRHKCIN